MLRGYRHDSLIDLRLTIFDFLGLVKNDIEPATSVSSLEYFNVSSQEFVRSNNDAIFFKSLINNTFFSLETPFFWIIIISKSENGDLILKASGPKIELFKPLINHCRRTDYQKWTNQLLVLISSSHLILVKRFPVSCAQCWDQCDGRNGFA